MTVRQDEFERGDVVRRYAVSERVGAAGVFGDVAADSAGFLAGRIGCEVKAGLFDSASEIEIDHSRLHYRTLILEVQLEDTIHAGEGDHQAAAASQCAAREARASAAADDRNVVVRGELHDAGDFIRRGGEDDGIGPAFLDRPVVFVKEHIFRETKDSGGSENLFEFAGQNLGHKHRSLGGARFTIESVTMPAQRCWDGGARSLW